MLIKDYNGQYVNFGSVLIFHVNGSGSTWSIQATMSQQDITPIERIIRTGFTTQADAQAALDRMVASLGYVDSNA